MPQLVNILTGQMSWVGPRTVSLGQAEVHSPWLPNLLTVKPGITGPWAVVGEHNLDEEMRLTMYYIRNWTIWMDLQILLQTAQRILRLERGKARLPER
ncbi:MAG: sugar transferase [Caldilineales bacterium]